MPSTTARSEASQVGTPRKAWPPASRKQCAGISATAPGGSRSAAVSIAASASAGSSRRPGRLTNPKRRDGDEGHCPGRRLGYTAFSADPRAFEATPADLRQADDLLSAVDPVAWRH